MPDSSERKIIYLSGTFNLKLLFLQSVIFMQMTFSIEITFDTNRSQI